MKLAAVKTIENLCDYISLYKRTIFIREKVDGKWGGYSLSELPTDLAIDHALRFIKEGRIPIRIREVKNDTSTSNS